MQYSTPVLFKALMEDLARTFMERNPSIRVTLRAPELGYEEIMQRNLRDAVTNQLPDVAFHGLNRQRTLDERGIPVDLKPFMEADPAATKELGYSPSLLSLGQIGAKQTGIGFALSTPILYFNADLLKAAGGDPDRLPTRWDELVGLAAAIHDPAQNRTGLFYDWTITGNWGWQALVRSHGGAFLNPRKRRSPLLRSRDGRPCAPCAASSMRRRCRTSSPRLRSRTCSLGGSHLDAIDGRSSAEYTREIAAASSASFADATRSRPRTPVFRPAETPP